MNRMIRALNRFFGSQTFFYAVLCFFVFEALWLVFSATYPMAFDEDFHLGVIRIYTEQWSPFLTAHPDGADQFGAVARDPSYLYHYLMSFPYRFITFWTQNETLQVIILRLLNVAMFTVGLALFRKVMLRAGSSEAFTHVALALFILIPIVPQLAAHINYDNLLMVLLPLMCLSVFTLTSGFRQRRVPTGALLGFLALGLYMSVIKYVALPLIIAAVIFLAVIFIKHFQGHFGVLGRKAQEDFRHMAKPVKMALLAVCAIGAVLFVQRYVVNFALYKTPVPDCGQVLTVEQCMAYGPWGRDYVFEQTKPAGFSANPVTYMGEWLKGMWLRLFFAVNGPASDFATRLPLPVPSKTAIVIVALGLAAVVLWWRKVFGGNTYLVFFGCMILVYCGVLWITEFAMYKQTGQPVAINGRYLLPILPMLAVILGRGMSIALSKLKLANVKVSLATLAILLFLHGGGFLTFILRSDPSWYWPNPGINNMNKAAQRVLAPLVIEGKK